MDAEEIIGMFSAGKQKSKNANVDFLRSRMRAKKNGIIAHVDSMFKDERERLSTGLYIEQERIEKKVSQSRLILERSYLDEQR